MRSEDFYRTKADECERKAAGAPDEATRARWLQMAADWRKLIQPAPPKPKPR